MVSRRQKCCEDEDCICQHCPDGKAACCIVAVVNSTESYTLIWNSDCFWENTLLTANLTFDATTATLITPEGTFTGALPADCTDFTDLPLTGPGGTATLTSAEDNECLWCRCSCPDCAAGFASCCYTVNIAGKWVPLINQGCSWLGTACPTTPVTLTISGTTAILDIGGDTYSTTAGTPINCCSPIQLESDSVPGQYITVFPSTGFTCQTLFECVQISFSGITNTCDCSACQGLNRSAGLTWTGNSYEGPICIDDPGIGDRLRADQCGFNYATVLASQIGGAGGRITAYLLEQLPDSSFNGSVKYEGFMPATDDGAQETLLSFVETNAPTTCGWGGSQASVGFGPVCAPCGDNVTCVDDIIEPCPCKDDSWPEYFIITVPNGFVGGWGFANETAFQVPFLGTLNTGNLGCLGVPYLVESHGCSGINSFWVRLRWNNPSNPGETLALLDWGFQWPELTSPLPCDDWGTRVDCWLYESEWSSTHFDPFGSVNYGCGGSWDGSQIKLKAFIP